MYLAFRLGLPTGWIYTAGFAAFIGHLYPVFFRFRGGQGMAAATGMLVWGMGAAIVKNQLAAGGVAGILVLAGVVLLLTRSASVVGTFAVPVLVVEVLLARLEWQFALFMTVLGVIIWTTQLGMAREGHLFRLSDPMRDRFARMRPHAR
jgi:glycerol-3-phosphate acyltransferase PlsY